LGAAQILTHRAEQGIAECERALAIDPNFASAHAWIGLAKYLIGRNEETEAHILEAFRISPRDTYAFFWMLIVGLAKLGAGCNEEAVSWLNRSIGLNRNHPTPYCLLAAALALLGRIEEAREAGRHGLDLNPSFTIARYRSSGSGHDPVYLAGLDRICEGMRLAGVPDG
jgi:tetratricopeptide (TPR) repeat protein